MKVDEVTLYLIGQITKDERTYQWRRDTRKHFSQFAQRIKFFDPCANDYSQEIMANSKTVKDFRTYVKNTPQFSRVLPVRDMNYVFSSDGAICNFNHYTTEKPFIGTHYELSWYMTQPWKTVIGVFDGDYTQDLQCMHPFNQRAVTTWTSSLEEAWTLVEKLFLT